MNKDITMCKNNKCTLKEQCYRFTKHSSEIKQPFGDFKQVNGDCSHFLASKDVESVYKTK